MTTYARPNIIAEVGMGYSSVLGLGEAYPFQTGGAFLRIDLPRTIEQTSELPPDIQDSNDAYGEPGQKIYLSRDALYAALQAARFGRAHSQELDLQHAANNLSSMERYFQMRGVPTASIYADGRRLPLATNSVREVVLSNVVSDPGTPEQARMQLLDEVLRVVDSKLGRVVTTDFYTPDVSDALYAAYVRPDITVQDYSSGSAEWRLLSRQYATGSGGTIHIISHKA